jgi:uncharacterized protein (DUF58 family)
VSLRPNAFVLLALMAMLGIVGDWSAANAPWWCLPAALLLLGLAYERAYASRASLALDVGIAARLRLGRPSMAQLRLTQKFRRGLDVELAPETPAGMTCDPTVRELRASAEFALGVVPRRLGRFDWPAQRARIGGPLALAWWPARLAAPAPFEVVPDLFGSRSVRDGLGPQGARHAPRRGSGSELLQLRPYQAGDALRSIDWKSTARSGALVARDHVEEQALDVIVAIDAGRASGVWCGALDRLGHFINVAARLAEVAVAQGDRIGLVVYGDRLLASAAPGRGLAAVLRVRKLLTAVRTESSDSNPIHAANHIRSLVRRRCLVILLTEIDDAASDGQLVSAVALLRGMHLPFVVGLRSLAADGFASAPAGDWRDPYRALAAAENRRIETRSVGALRALGVHALLARPERLEAELFAAYATIRRHRLV